jgi:hypothetical protein
MLDLLSTCPQYSAELVNLFMQETFPCMKIYAVNISRLSGILNKDPQHLVVEFIKQGYIQVCSGQHINPSLKKLKAAVEDTMRQHKEAV